ncbi:MAG: alanine racemase [Balneolaceae bacterium]|nr:alanine racemase [Balneolaceae bacterium]MBO6546603.1 alanine racemase [Balneolaceae bacterium]MBO6648961.1 alanine racemase [Balneolaceae bacterium]
MNTKAIIHLSKLDHNLNAIDRRLKPGVRRMAVVKDDAYGHGLIPLSKHIQQRVEWLCVAHALEGKQLREAGITIPILVFEAPLEETASLYTDFNLTATLNEIDTLKVLLPGSEYQINIDTGMHRLGVLPGAVSKLVEEIPKYENLTCTGIYTHYFKADDPGNPEVKQQLELFKAARAQFPSEWMTHTANTGGIFHYGNLDLQFDAVRPGVCLYGFGAGEVDVPDLEPIMDIKSFLMQVKPVRKGEPVSYGGKWIASEDGFIGIIPTGYSDGIPRILTNSIKLKIGEKLYDQVGVISMDYTIVFLGSDQYPIGTEVYLLKGKELTATDWAKVAHTIPYEITTSIRERVKKIYL